MNANLQAAPSPPVTLPVNLGWLAKYAQFVVCDFVPKADAPGKTDKRPINPATLQPCSAHEPANWLSCDVAIAKANELNGAARGVYGIGFVITPEQGIWCLDIDKGLDSNNQWLPAVQELFTKLNGVAAWELSHSKRGLHGWGRTATPIDAHETRYTDAAAGLHLELYSRKRFIALGSAPGVTAAAEVPAAPLPPVLVQLFPVLGADDAAALDAEWTDEPHPTWHGPTNDTALITIALRSKSKLATLWPNLGKATFKQLWEADAEALCKHYPGATGGYDESKADQALACHLAFWFGNNWGRMAAMMERSGLNRPKYHDRADYLHRTIGKACAWQKKFYNDGKGVVAGAPVPAANASTSGIGLNDFHAYLPQNSYIFVPTREPWAATGVDSAVKPWPNDGMKPSAWLNNARPVHQMTWVPGEEMIIANRVAADGGWILREGANTFNLYRPPTIQPGDAAQAGPWLDLLKYVYPQDVDHIVKWFAHRRQHPSVKINHALVFGGSPGVGKDTIIEPLKQAVGPWNLKEVAPKDLLGDFNPHVKAVVLRVSEARDSGDMNKYSLYEHCKTLLAAPPDVLRCNEKNLREHSVFNVLGVIFTTNHRDGLYLPPDDRRHFVVWSERDRSEFQASYWRDIYRWYEAGGVNHVVAYLDAVDLTAFDPKAEPAKTPAFWAMVDAGRAPEEGDMADALERLGNPPAVTLSQLQGAAGLNSDLQNMLKDPRSRRQLPHRLGAAGYVTVPNAAATDRLWKVAGKRQVIYGRKELTEQARLVAAADLCQRTPATP